MDTVLRYAVSEEEKQIARKCIPTLSFFNFYEKYCKGEKYK